MAGQEPTLSDLKNFLYTKYNSWIGFKGVGFSPQENFITIIVDSSDAPLVKEIHKNYQPHQVRILIQPKKHFSQF